MEIGFVGTGTMGYNMVLRLSKKGHKVLAHNRSPEPLYKLHKSGINVAFTFEELFYGLKSPRAIWLMIPAGEVTKVLELMVEKLEPGDTIIDGGRSFYKDSIKRYRTLKNISVDFIDAGVIGVPEDISNGLSIMVGGDKKVFDKFERLFRDLSVKDGYGYLGEHGAGHYANAVLEKIESGIMSSFIKGVDQLKNSEFGYDIEDVLNIFAGSQVISPGLIDRLADAKDQYE
jgi:6-phosphogluconate dehydrogenase